MKLHERACAYIDLDALTGNLEQMKKHLSGDAQIIADGIMEQVSFLGHKAFHITKISGVDFIHISLGNFHITLLHLPKTHK